MGKGGVGKTTVATNIALKLKERGAKVHLTTTDPANHLNYDLAIKAEIDISKIDEAEVLEAYKNEVRAKARENKMTTEDMEYIEEDLRSPCTQEIAVFKAFARYSGKSRYGDRGNRYSPDRTHLVIAGRNAKLPQGSGTDTGRDHRSGGKLAATLAQPQRNGSRYRDTSGNNPGF